jgi:hypothetical protein
VKIAISLRDPSVDIAWTPMEGSSEVRSKRRNGSTCPKVAGSDEVKCERYPMCSHVHRVSR